MRGWMRGFPVFCSVTGQADDEAALPIGGRVAENIGFLAEIGLAGIAVKGIGDERFETEAGEVPVRGEGIALAAAGYHCFANHTAMS